MYVIEKQVGRLIEARIASPLTLADVESIVQRVRLLVISSPSRAVCCVELTGLEAMPQEATDAFVALFTRDNPRVERSGFLLARKMSAIALQVDRMIRQAGGASRKSSDDPAFVEAWLGEVLDAPERERLHQFLTEPRSAGHRSGKMPTAS